MDKRTILYILLLALSFYLVQVFFAPKTDISKIKEIKTEKRKEERFEKEKLPREDENFYVLENEYQQLVFSDFGGSVVEINLPLKGDSKDSIINPTEFDTRIKKDYPNNAYFPQKDFFLSGNAQKEKKKLGGYYPLLRRSIYDKEGKVLTYIKPNFYALNIKGEESDLSNIKFQISRFEKDLIEFTGSDGKRKIKKRYSLTYEKGAPYIFNLEIEIDGKTDNLFLSSGALETELISNRQTPSLKYKTKEKNRTKVKNISLPKGIKAENVFVDWIGDSNGFFGIIIDPLTDIRPGYRAAYLPGNQIPTRLSIIDAKYNLYPPSKYPGYEISIPVSKKSSYRIFAGPYQDHILKLLDDIYENPTSGYNPEYIKVKAIKGWFSFASEPFSKFLLIIMRLFYNLTRSWGLSIILLTVVFRLMLLPLNSWSIKSTLKMQEITPLLKVIDAKYKKDPKKANMEKMKLFKDKGANPLSGCLPLLIQLPFLFGMFNLLRTTFDLRGVGFIPGWIDNLTSPDVLFSWNYPIFFIGTSFHLLPILLGIVMFVQSKMNMKNTKGENLTDQQKQQKLMGYFMPVLFVILFYKAASGLNIYFLFSMFLGIVQQWYMTKKKKIS